MVKVFINNVTAEQPKGAKRMGKEQARAVFKTAEAFSHKDTEFIEINNRGVDAPITNPLITVAYNSFAKHIPMVLTPDIIWHTIMQGVSMHVNKSPERFRSLFTKELKKREIKVRDDTLIPGSWDNQWDRSIDLIKEQLLQFLPDTSIIKTQFTTTGPAECIAHTAAFMDVVKNYYKYTVFTMCGIPWVDVTGTVEDWETMGKVLDPFLKKLDLTMWNEELQTIIRHFADAARGQADKEHWNRMFKYHGPAGSGGVAGVSGWLGKLFLYTRDGLNPLFVKRDEGGFYAHPQQIALGDFPAGLTVTPFNWNVFNRTLKMSLVAGLIGITVTSDGALKPEVGWIIGSEANTTKPSPPEENIEKIRMDAEKEKFYAKHPSLRELLEKSEAVKEASVFSKVMSYFV